MHDPCRMFQLSQTVLHSLTNRHPMEHSVPVPTKENAPAQPPTSTASQQSCLSFEFPTQNELTQLGDVEDNDDDDECSPDEEGELHQGRRRKRRQGKSLAASSPAVNWLEIPWGRLVPAATAMANESTAVDLFPRDPLTRISHVAASTRDRAVSFLGLHHLHFSDRFNEFVIGRSNKCDVIAHKRPTANSSQDWVHAMISNRHVRIFCMLAKTCAQSQRGDMEVYVEDTSGNGTLINQSILLQRGERRELHTGDTICLINPNTLKKKIRSKAEQQDILSQYTWIFINLFATNSHWNDIANADAAVAHTNTLLLEDGTTNPSIGPSATLDAVMPPHTQMVKGILRFSSLQKIQQQLFIGPGLDTDNEQALDSLSPSSNYEFTTNSSLRPGLVNARAVNSLFQEKDSVNHVWIETKRVDKKHEENNDFKESTLEMPPPEKKRRSSPRLRPRGMTNNHPRFEEIYDVRDLLGSGTCGEVRRAIHRRSGKVVAVKIIPTGAARNPAAPNHQNPTTALQAEANILQNLHHPYIVQLYDVFVQPQTVFLVMELLHGGDLLDRIILKGRYSETESRRVMRRLFAAIFYLHEECDIVHRDLKPENIICVSKDSDIMIKLTDFGLAKSVSQEGCKTFCGTPQYFAPEVLRRQGTITGRGRYGKEADMWSLGIILYILLSGEPPFDISAGMEVVEKALICFDPDRWRGISDNAMDLILKLLIKEPKARIKIVDACRHGWILEDDGDTHTFPLDDPLLGAFQYSCRVKDGSIFPRKEQGSSKLPSYGMTDHPNTAESSSMSEPLQKQEKMLATPYSNSIKTISQSKQANSHCLDAVENIDLLSPNQAANFPSPFSTSVGRETNQRMQLRRRRDSSLFSCVKQLSKAGAK